MGTKVSLWTVNNGEIPANLAFTNNFTATAAPGVNNDKSVGQGYRIGSVWIYAGVWYVCTDDTIGAAVWSTGNGGTTPGQIAAPAASTPTGAGGTAALTGGTGGTTSGNGGAADVTGGAATAGNGSGGSVVLTGGAKNGTGIAGGVRVESILVRAQAAPTAKTVSATLTGPELLAGIVTINQGAGATSAQQLPTGTAIQNVLPADFAVGDSFDVSVMNISTVDAEDATVTTNTDLTLVGNMDFPAHSGITIPSQGMLRFRKTADHVFSVYRIA